MCITCIHTIFLPLGKNLHICKPNECNLRFILKLAFNSKSKMQRIVLPFNNNNYYYTLLQILGITKMVTAQWNMAISFAWFILLKYNIEAERTLFSWSYLVSIKCSCSGIVFFLNSHVWSEVWLRFKEGFGLAISTNLVPKK